MTEKFTVEHQQLMLGAMLADATLFARCQNVIAPEYFAKPLQKAVTFMLDFARDYVSLPGLDVVAAKTQVQLPAVQVADAGHAKFYLEEIDAFCKHAALVNAVLVVADMVENHSYAGIEKIIRDSLLVGLSADLGTDYYLDPRARLLKLKEENGNMSTGWKTLDDKLYSVSRGELMIFCAPSGHGKSVVLQNLVYNMSLQALNTIYITLELSEGLSAKRIDSMVTGIDTKEIFKNLDAVHDAVKTTGAKCGSIMLKKLPGGSTSRDIRAYIKEYQIQTHNTPDVIIVDYLDVMRPADHKIDPSDVSNKDKYVSEELRNLADELNILCFTASQFNRSSVAEGVNEYNMGQIAGGYSKIMTADNVVGIYNTENARNRGEIEFQFLKTRNAGSTGQKLIMGYDRTTLRITDLAQDHVPASITAHSIMAGINRSTGTTSSSQSTSARPALTATAGKDPKAQLAAMKNLMKK